MTPAVVVSFIESPDRTASWLAYHRNSTWIDALVPPGSIAPWDHSARLIAWTRCSWEEVDPQVAAPEKWDELSVADALACARKWEGRGETQHPTWPVTERWVLESSVVYAHLLLSHVRERMAHEGDLSPEVSSRLADPAFDLISQLQEIAKNPDRPAYYWMLQEELECLRGAQEPTSEGASKRASLAATRQETDEIDFSPVYAGVSQ